MAEKYHISPKTGRPNRCYAEARPCPVGGPGEHYPSKTEAQAASERKLQEEFGVAPSAKRDPQAALRERLRGEAPEQVDGELAALYYKQGELQGQADTQADRAARAEASLASMRARGLEEDHPNVETYRESAAKCWEAAKKFQQEADALEESMRPYQEEYSRRPWPRAFLVSGSEGHVHQDMACSTCYPTTRYQWMTAYSGKSESEIVEDAGERACTVCYPSAPVEVRSRPTKMFTREEEAAARAREEREAARKLKEAKAAAGAITGEDGGPLRVPTWSGGFETVKTERSAQIAAVDALVDVLSYKRDQEEGRARSSAGSTLGEKKLAVLLPALALKRELPQAEVEADLRARAERKLKQQEKEAAAWAAKYGG